MLRVLRAPRRVVGLASRSSWSESVGSRPRYAVLVDAENAEAATLSAIVDEIATFGDATIRRAYGDFSNPNLAPWKTVSLEHSFRRVNADSFSSGKGSADAAMIIEAMDLLHTMPVDGFCLVSSDSDFTGLAQRLREASKSVMGFGRRTTPKAFVMACERFIYVDNLIRTPTTEGSSYQQQEQQQQRQQATSRMIIRKRNPPSFPASLKEIMERAVEACTTASGWAELGMVGKSLLAHQSDFDPRTYGHPKLLTLMQSMDDFYERKLTGRGCFVRRRPRSQQQQLERKESPPPNNNSSNTEETVLMTPSTELMTPSELTEAIDGSFRYCERNSKAPLADGWIDQSFVGAHLKHSSNVDPRAYGFLSLKGMLIASGGYDVEPSPTNVSRTHMRRRRRKWALFDDDDDDGGEKNSRGFSEDDTALMEAAALAYRSTDISLLVRIILEKQTAFDKDNVLAVVPEEEEEEECGSSSSAVDASQNALRALGYFLLKSSRIGPEWEKIRAQPEWAEAVVAVASVHLHTPRDSRAATRPVLIYMASSLPLPVDDGLGVLLEETQGAFLKLDDDTGKKKILDDLSAAILQGCPLPDHADGASTATTDSEDNLNDDVTAPLEAIVKEPEGTPGSPPRGRKKYVRSDISFSARLLLSRRRRP